MTCGRWGFALIVLIGLFALVTGCIGLLDNPFNASEMMTRPMANTTASIPVDNETFWIHINPIGNPLSGDLIFINGTTNLNVGDEILVEVYPFYLEKSSCGIMEVPGGTGVIHIIEDPLKKSHEFNVTVNTASSWDASPWKPQEYIIKSQSLLYPVKDQVNFTLMPSALSANVSFPTTPSCNWRT